jgi:hypothetical protein
MPSTTPIKRFVTNIKTLEQIRLERIQAESAAFYQYDTSLDDQSPSEEDPISRLQASDVKQRFLGRRALQSDTSSDDEDISVKQIQTSEVKRRLQVSEVKKRLGGSRVQHNGDSETSTPVIKVLTLEEIRERKRRRDEELQTDEKNGTVKEITHPENNKRLKAPDTEIRRIFNFPSVETIPLTEISPQKGTIPDMEARNVQKSPPKSRIKPPPTTTRRVTVTRNKKVEGSPPKKRSHSPVIFDLGEKSNKQIRTSAEEDPQVKISPVKPIVAVAARKRPHAEDSVVPDISDRSKVTSPTPPSSPSLQKNRILLLDEPDICNPKASDKMATTSPGSSPQLKEESPTIDTSPSPKTTRRSWRTSRQTKPEEREYTPTPVFTRKIRLRKSASDSKIEESLSDNSINNSVPDEIKEPLANDSSSIKQYKHPSSLIITSPNPSELDSDLHLFSPSSEPSGNHSFDIPRGAEDILQDIDALLND